MALGSFARGALAALQPADLQRMLELDESLFVEHKSDIGKDSSYGLAKTVASFANTLGGWLLIGVRDGKPHGTNAPWAVGEAPSLVDVVRDRLRTELDPLPAFEARVMDTTDGPVGVVRVYESSDTPHVSISTGSIFVREVAGQADAAQPKRPGAKARGDRAYEAAQIRSRSQLLELAGRGELSGARVSELMNPGRPLQLVRDRLGLTFEQITADGWQPRLYDFGSVYVRIAPYTLPDRFRGWATTAEAMAAVLRAAEDISLRRGLANNFADPHPAGVSVTVGLETGARHTDGAGLGLDAHTRVAADGAGVVGAVLNLSPPEDERRRSWMDLDTVGDQIIAPVVRAVAGILEAGEFLGRARCQIDLIALGRAMFLEGTERVGAYVPTWSDVTLPAVTSDIDDIVRLAGNALARSGGVPAWDPPPGPH